MFLKQTPRVDLDGHVGELLAPTVGDDHVAPALERLEVVRHLAGRRSRARPWPSRGARCPHRARAEVVQPILMVRRHTSRITPTALHPGDATWSQSPSKRNIKSQGNIKSYAMHRPKQQSADASRKSSLRDEGIILAHLGLYLTPIGILSRSATGW